MDDLKERQFGRCPFVGVECEYVPLADRIEALEAELAIAQDYKGCGCSYDHPNDLCLGHEKLFKRLTDKRIEALEAKVKEAGEAMSLCSREMLEEWFPEHLAEQFIATLAKLQEHSHDA